MATTREAVPAAPAVRSTRAVPALVVLLLAGIPGPTHAQARLAPLPDGPAPGGQIESFRYEDAGSLTAFTFHQSVLKHNGLGLELGVGMFPQALPAAALVLTPDVGIAYNISLPAITLLVRGGTGAITGLARNVAFIPGAHLGAGLLLQVDRRGALRADVLRRWYRADGETERFWSVALGFAVLRR
jgi:hypothetical protein